MADFEKLQRLKAARKKVRFIYYFIRRNILEQIGKLCRPHHHYCVLIVIGEGT